jgi:hypothetical protein
LACSEHGNIEDIKLVDFLFAVKRRDMKSEAANLVDFLAYEGTNNAYLGNEKYEHEFDFSHSAPEFLPALTSKGRIDPRHKKLSYD